MKRVGIWTRESYMVNTDPQRRCYNGCNFSERKEWTEWTMLYTVPEDEAEACLASWRSFARPTSEFEARPVEEQTA